MRILLFIGFLVLILGVGLFMIMPVDRMLDAEPIYTTAETALPPGIAELSFDLNTCCDQMSLRRSQVGLAYVVQYGDTLIQQQFANCWEAGTDGSGSDALDSVTAFCDGRTFRFEFDPEKAGSVYLMEIKEGADPVYMFSVPLLYGSGIQTIRYNRDLHMRTY